MPRIDRPEASAGDRQGLGYTYAATATATLVRDVLAKVVIGCEAMDVTAAWAAMRHAIRNQGRPGVTSTAMAAVDVALWDLRLSAHTAPALHLHPCRALDPVIHIEYFFAHVRIEDMLFDGARHPVDGELRPDLSRPGPGLTRERSDARPFAA